MSSELGDRSAGAPVPRTRDRFTRRFLGSVVVLAIATGGFAFASVVQGPRLNAADIDARQATVLAGQRLTLEVNQPVADLDADRVAVEPAAAVTASADDRTITITFEAPLDYATDYTVSVPGVVGAYQGAAATLEYRFRTPGEHVYSLDRRSDRGEDDVVQRKQLAGAQGEVVFEAPRIQEFSHSGELLLAVTVNDDESNALFVTDVRSGGPQQFGLGEGAAVRDLAASTTNPLAGFVLTTPEVDGVRDYDNALMTVDLSGVGGMEPAPVLGLDGAPIKVMSWLFVPGTTSVVVQDFDQSVFLVDVVGATPVSPLGVHSELRGFVPGTTQLIVADPDRGARIDLGDGTTTTLELESADLAENVYTGAITMLDADSRYLVSLVAMEESGGVAKRSSMLAEVDGSGEMRAVYAPASETSMIREYCVSPNGRYAAVAESAGSGRADGYSGEPGFTETMTTVVEIDTARIVMSLNGGFSDWCAS